MPAVNASNSPQNPVINPVMGKYTAEEIREFADTVRRDGFCILRGHFPVDLITEWRKAFEPLMAERIANGTASARGPNRYYISLPFTRPFADTAVYEDEDILAILDELADGDLVMPELASDTPLKDSDYQVIHRDHSLQSPDLPELDPSEPFQFAVNFPLVDVTEENGPFEIVRGSHLIEDEVADEMVRSGEAEAKFEPLLMSAGDVMVRDVRGLHRGTPNRTDTPRTMVVVGYNRSGHKRPQLKINIPRVEWEHLSERGKQLLRLNPIVDSLEEADISEAYSNLYFLEKGQ
ncbi:MAG: phytanoyl-CoA dioxygenase family protein [Pyrinomonadaceae bacterium]